MVVKEHPSAAAEHRNLFGVVAGSHRPAVGVGIGGVFGYLSVAAGGSRSAQMKGICEVVSTALASVLPMVIVGGGSSTAQFANTVRSSFQGSALYDADGSRHCAGP